MKLCVIEDCAGKHYCRGWCQRHYTRWQRHGDPNGRAHHPRLCEVDGCGQQLKARGLCSHHYNRAYYAADAEGQRERARQWYSANQARKNAYDRGRKTENAARVRAYYARNRDAVREAKRQYRAQNPDAVAAAQRRYSKRHADRVLAKNIARYARLKGAPGHATSAQIRARTDYYGGLCWMCGGDADSIDHVKPLARGGSNWPANLRPACRPCNSRKNDRWEGSRSLF